MFSWMWEKVKYVWGKAKDSFVSTTVVFSGSWALGKAFGKDWDILHVEDKYNKNELIAEGLKFTGIGTALGIGLDAILPKGISVPPASSDPAGPQANLNLPRNPANPQGPKL